MKTCHRVTNWQYDKESHAQIEPSISVIVGEHNIFAEHHQDLLMVLKEYMYVDQGGEGDLTPR